MRWCDSHYKLHLLSTKGKKKMKYVCIIKISCHLSIEYETHDQGAYYRKILIFESSLIF